MDHNRCVITDFIVLVSTLNITCDVVSVVKLLTLTTSKGLTRIASVAPDPNPAMDTVWI